jgi:hypothetical protein
MPNEMAVGCCASGEYTRSAFRGEELADIGIAGNTNDGGGLNRRVRRHRRARCLQRELAGDGSTAEPVAPARFQLDLASDGLDGAEEPPGRLLAEDDDRASAGAVTIVETASAQDRHAKRLKDPWRRGDPQSIAARAGLHNRPVGGRNQEPRRVRCAEGHARRDGGAVDPRILLELVEHTRQRPLRTLVIPLLRPEVHRREGDVVEFDAGVVPRLGEDVLLTQRGKDEEAGADGHLPAHQPALPLWS